MVTYSGLTVCVSLAEVDLNNELLLDMLLTTSGHQTSGHYRSHSYSILPSEHLDLIAHEA